MCRHFLVPSLALCTHIPWCHGGVMAACLIRQLGGAGSIPVRGSDKTNDEVVASPYPEMTTWGNIK